MRSPLISRRGLFRRALAALGAYGLVAHRSVCAAPPEIKLPTNVPEQAFDFDAKGIEGWTIVEGQWAAEDLPCATLGKKVLVQRATKNQFNVIVAPGGPFTDMDVSVKFTASR